MQRQVGADRVLRVRDDDDVYRVKEWFFFQEKVQVAEKQKKKTIINAKMKNKICGRVYSKRLRKKQKERERQLFGRKKNSLIEIEFRRGTFQYELWKDFFFGEMRGQWGKSWNFFREIVELRCVCEVVIGGERKKSFKLFNGSKYISFSILW